MTFLSQQFQSIKQNVRNSPYPSYDSRISDLKKLKSLLTSDIEGLTQAIQADFGKPYSEILLTEILTVVHELDFHLKNLSKWIKPEKVKGNLITFPSKSEIHSVPYGVCLIIGAWNYPIHLLLLPLIGAISSGNRVILKPSELAVHTSSWIKKAFEHHFPSNQILVIEGGAETNKHLLELPFDKIFFTGSTRVGKIVMESASKHLTPVTLELGGKSPAILFDDANLNVSTKRIWFGKCINAGQTCVAPDYVLVHQSNYDAFVSASRTVLKELYPNGYTVVDNYTKIINDRHFDRLISLLAGADIVLGGDKDVTLRYIEPTLVRIPDWGHPLMQEEIFGPLLPVLTYSNDAELKEHLEHTENPLACYLFTESKQKADKWIREFQFGGGCVNDTLSHLGNSRLPFGGVGTSGTGSYHGKTSFDVFSHKKSILKRNTWFDTSLRYQPLNRLNKAMEFLIK